MTGSPKVFVLVRLAGPVIDSMEAGVLDYIFDSLVCDGPSAGDFVLLAFRRSSVDSHWSTIPEMSEPFVWYNYQTGDVISLPARISVVKEPCSSP